DNPAAAREQGRRHGHLTFRLCLPRWIHTASLRRALVLCHMALQERLTAPSFWERQHATPSQTSDPSSQRHSRRGKEQCLLGPYRTGAGTSSIPFGRRSTR